MSPNEPSFTLRDYITPLRTRIPPTLINPASLIDLEQFAATIPGAVSSFFGFECPLENDATQPGKSADLLFCSTQLEGHSRILAGTHRSISLPHSLVSSPDWQKVQEFCQHWEDPESALYQRLLNIWLEFDIGQSSPPYAPSLFFGMLPNSQDNATDCADTIYNSLEKLAADALSGQRGKTLERVLLNPANEGAHVFQVGVMLAREMPAIRVCLRGIEPQLILPTLTNWGWPADAGQLATAIEKFGPLCSRIDVDIDVGKKIGAKVGLECSFGQHEQTVQQMHDMLQTLVQAGLTNKNQAQALLGYNGLVHQDSNTSVWHEHLLRMAALQGSGVINYLSCWLNHIKIVVDGDKPLSAKAYLAVLADREKRTALRSRLAELPDN